jgi:hypothetical protein
MKVYGASIDSVQIMSGYGAVERNERPRGVPSDWVIRTATIEGRSTDYDELAARTDAMTQRLITEGYYPHGWSIPENPEGDFGPAEVTYWGPPGEDKDTWRTVGLILGVAASGISVIGAGIAIMDSQY